jgi:hypothetical protein
VIIKSLSRKSGTGQLFNYLFKYMLAEEKRTGKATRPLTIRHNVRARTVAGFIREFERNEKLRIHKRKNAIHVHHEIISFSNKDSQHITDKVLRDMAKKYIELRGKDNLFVITPHHDRDHIHLHCAMSGTKLNGMSSRISRQEFAKLKVELDRYQQERYPQLLHSLPKHGRAKQTNAREELKNAKRAERCTDRNAVLLMLDETFSISVSKDQFLTNLASKGCTPYYRAGRLTGVKYNGERKFRLNGLGYDEAKIDAIGKQINRMTKQERMMQELQEIRNRQAYRTNERDYEMVRERS